MLNEDVHAFHGGVAGDAELIRDGLIGGKAGGAGLVGVFHQHVVDGEAKRADLGTVLIDDLVIDDVEALLPLVCQVVGLIDVRRLCGHLI
jgi:hypothetical protein